MPLLLSVARLQPHPHRSGLIKKTPLHAFEKITARGLIAVSLVEGDRLVRASLCEEADSVLLCSALGQAVRFSTDAENLRASGRQSRGVKSMGMRAGDEIADMFVIRGTGAEGGCAMGESDDDNDAEGDGELSEEEGQGQQLVAVTRRGYGKRMDSSLFRCQKRGGKGVIAMKFKRKDDRLLALSPFEGVSQLPGAETAEQELLLITQKGVTVRQRLSRISVQGRATTGVALQKLDEDDLVASVDIVPAAEEQDEEEEEDDDEDDQEGAVLSGAE